MVVGDRRVAEIEHFSGAKKALQRLGSWVVRRLSGTAIADTTSGFRAYNREAALGLLVVDNFTYTLESLIQAGKMLVAVDQVRDRDQPADARVAALPLDRRLRAPQRALDPPHLRPLRAAAGVRHRRPGSSACSPSAPGCRSCSTGSSTATRSGHIQSLILGAVLFIAAVQLLALGVIGDLLAGQRVMTQRVFERVRRVELALGRRALALRARRPRDETAKRKAPRRLRRPADYGKTASFLAVGVGLTGVITYVYFLIASHMLSRARLRRDHRRSGRRSSSPSRPSTARSTSCSRATSPNTGQGESTREPMRVAAKIQLGLAAASPSSPWPCAGRSRTACWTATRRSTGSSSRRSSSTRRATSPAASSPATAASASSRR